MSIYGKIKRALGAAKVKELDERDAKLVPIAKEIVSIIARHSPPVGNITHDEIVAGYFPITTRVLDLMREKNILLKDVSYTMQLVMQAFDTTNKLVIDSVNKSLEKAENRVWGMAKEDVPFQLVDSILRYQGEPTFDQSILRTDSELQAEEPKQDQS